MPDLSGRTLGKYQIIERLGKGGMAEVYKAYQPGLERYVAIKVLLPHLADSDDFIGRFRREAKAVSNLHHANIVQVFDFDLDDANNYYYMVMEFIDGATLKDRLAGLSRAGQTMSIAETISFFEGLLAGVGYAHAQGMVHRDLKPANVMFDRAGRPVLTDFGIAKMVGAARYTVTGAVVGTLAYMSPEQAQGAPGDERSDIYALGIVLYEALTGQLPYDADTPLAVMLKHISEPVPVLRQFSSDFPEALEKAVFRALAKNPDDRYQSAADMWEALRAIRDGVTGIVHASVIPATAEKSRTPALADQSTPPA
ncbi:MAG: serine/threonine protein kinase, partial [Chloroflexi bacterium]|nr:serine/threonine protein kinase [Chloroflexota bacterium]